MKKVNPRRKPATMADVQRAKVETMMQSIAMVEAIFLTVLVDKFGFEDKIEDFWKETNKLSDELKQGYVSYADLIHVLNEEYGIDIGAS